LNESKETEPHLLTPPHRTGKAERQIETTKEAAKGNGADAPQSPRRNTHPFLAPIILRLIISIDVSVGGGQSALWTAKAAKGREFQK
jgi:hypothetical protein